MAVQKFSTTNAAKHLKILFKKKLVIKWQTKKNGQMVLWFVWIKQQQLHWTHEKKQTHTHSTEIKCKWSKQSTRAMANAICVNWREYTKKHTHTAIKITITSALKRQQQQRLHFYIIKLKLCSRFFATKSHYKYLSFFSLLCVFCTRSRCTRIIQTHTNL